MPAVPEFMLRKLVVKNSFKETDKGFTFQINNTFAPATILGFELLANGEKIAPESISLRSAGSELVQAQTINEDNPFPLSVGVILHVNVKDEPLGEGNLSFAIETREAGSLAFSLKANKEQPGSKAPKPGGLMELLGLKRSRPIKVDVNINAEDVIGEINPFVYGQFVEHLERCVYDGIWTADGSALRPDTLKLIKELKPPIIRYPGGNFASGYHWEDGIGPKEQRPQRTDEAWNTEDSNQVGTDEFLAFCQKIESEPFLVVNTGNGTPEEAARWVSYCNDPADSDQGKRRAENGHPEPYNVRVWGIGNEVWGQWQIGHTDAETHARQLVEFAKAMKAVDPDIHIVAVGDKIISDEPNDAGRKWNEIILREAGEYIDDLSIHLYQPDQDGWRESYDPDELHHIICAAPLAAEKMLERVAAQIKEIQPERKIGIAFDEWNLWLPPDDSASSMHDINYCLRDALYLGGMLNVFHRQAENLNIANLAQLVNVLPLIVTNEDQAYATPLYHVFNMYQDMQKIALKVGAPGKFYDSKALGLNIEALQDVPYVDVSATRDEEGKKLVLGMINRHQKCRAFITINLEGFDDMILKGGKLLSGTDLQAVNTFEEPENVKPRVINMPSKKGKKFRLDLSPACVATLILDIAD